MKIGELELSNNVFLAPMAGVTDIPFRRMCKKFGCGLVYSEMVSAKGLYYNDTKTNDLMELFDDEKPAAIQIFGSEPEIIKTAVPKVIKKGAAIIDINMGCPTPKIVNNGDGSALAKNPALAGKIIEAAVCNSSIPVTVKIRSGWDNKSINATEMAKIAQANGAAAISVHSRTREQFYSGKADWSIIRQVKKSVSIPVIGNGDIFCAEDAKQMLEQTECDAVMIGRGAQGNPFIFTQINELFAHGKISFYPTDADRINVCCTLLDELVKIKGKSRGVKESRKHIAWFIKGMRNSSQIKNLVFKMTQPDEIKEVLHSMLQHC